jgi:hypothetical protein
MTYREAIIKSIAPLKDCKDKDGRDSIPFSFWYFSSSLAAIYAGIWDLDNPGSEAVHFIQAINGVDFMGHIRLTQVFRPFLSWLLEQELTEEEADVTEKNPWFSWTAVADRYNEWVRTEAKKN